MVLPAFGGAADNALVLLALAGLRLPSNSSAVAAAAAAGQLVLDLDSLDEASPQGFTLQTLTWRSWQTALLWWAAPACRCTARCWGRSPLCCGTCSDRARKATSPLRCEGSWRCSAGPADNAAAVH